MKTMFQILPYIRQPKLISKAHGFLGSCEEYLNYTVSSLTELNIIDKRMNDIYNLIKHKKI